MDLPRHHTIRESSHRILDPFTDAQLATLGPRAAPDARAPPLLDLACGKGELLCTWARDHGTVGTGVDLNTVVRRRGPVRARRRSAST